MKIDRCKENPIIAIDDVKPLLEGFEVIGVFNAGVCVYGDQTILLLRVAERPVSVCEKEYPVPIFDSSEKRVKILNICRSEGDADFRDTRVIRTNEGKYLTSISYVRLARSRDGIHFAIEDQAFIFPQNEYEAYGIEDCRVIETEGKYYINYSAVSAMGITTYLGYTENFQTFFRIGNIFCVDNKDVVIIPEKINGFYYALHRPATGFGSKNEIWISQSPDLVYWGNHRFMMGCRDGMWDGCKIGGGAPPVLTSHGYLAIYHGVDIKGTYALGAILLDRDDPCHILGRSKDAILKPEMQYEKDGFFGNVVFTDGVLMHKEMLKIYYGAADCCICCAEVSVTEILESLEMEL